MDDGRAAVPVDIDGDGDLDWVLHSLQGLRLMENTLPPQRFARIRVVDGLGATVGLTAGGVTQRDYVHLTEGFESQVPGDLHFGLNDATQIETLVVNWPHRDAERFGPLPTDRLITIRRGAAPTTSELPRWPETRRLPAKFSYGVSANRLDGSKADRIATVGQPVVINFWASWCTPCTKELPMLDALATDLEHVQFVGIAVDKKPADAAKMASQLSYPQFLANDDLVQSFFGESGEIPLPTTFVFDRAGNLQRAFQRAIARDELSPLLESLKDREIHADDMETYAGALALQGRFEESIQWLEKVVAINPDHEKAHYEMGLAYSRLGRHSEAVRSWKRSFELIPDNTHAIHNIADTLAQTGQPEDALIWYDRYLALIPDDATTLQHKAAAAAKAGKLELARDAFLASTKLNPNSVDVWLALARVEWMRRDKNSARQALQQVLRIDPKHRKARELLQTVQ